MLALPAAVGQQDRARGEILERRRVCRRSLGALSRAQVEFSQLLTLVRQGRAAIELMDDLEYRVLSLLRARVRGEQPPYSEMSLGACLFRDQRIAGFLDPIVSKLVRAIQTPVAPR